MGHRGLLQVDKAEHHRESPLGVFGKRGQSTPLGGDYSLPYGGKNKSRLQKPLFNHRGGNFDPYLRHGKAKQDDSIISNQNVKERTLFDDI